DLRALNDSRMRYVFAMRTTSEADIEAARATFIDRNPLGSLEVAGTVDEASLPAQVAIARKLGVKLHAHLLEAEAQRAGDPVALLERAGALALGRDLIVAHAVHLTPAEIQLLGARGAVVSHQPLSNMRLASGIFPWASMKSAGIPIGLGIDGGTNDTTDA